MVSAESVEVSKVTADSEGKEKVTEEEKGGKPSVASRGIPSAESFYLPAHYSKELRKFEENETPTMNFWTIEEVVNFVFPKKYQSKYYETALSFVKELFGKMRMNGKDLGNFVRNYKISKATFYNRILPRLKRAGLIKVEREAVIEGNRKARPMIVSLSKTFGNYLNKIGNSWLAIVDDARTRKRE